MKCQNWILVARPSWAFIQRHSSKQYEDSWSPQTQKRLEILPHCNWWKLSTTDQWKYHDGDLGSVVLQACNKQYDSSSGWIVVETVPCVVAFLSKMVLFLVIPCVRFTAKLAITKVAVSSGHRLDFGRRRSPIVSAGVETVRWQEEDKTGFGLRKLTIRRSGPPLAELGAGLVTLAIRIIWNYRPSFEFSHYRDGLSSLFNFKMVLVPVSELPVWGNKTVNLLKQKKSWSKMAIFASRMTLIWPFSGGKSNIV